MIKIRPEKGSDREGIYKVNELAFRRNVESRLVDKLRESESYVDGLSLVVRKDYEIVGHILFTKVTIEPVNEDFVALSLAPLAVKPEHQRQGIGSYLVTEGLQRCRSKGFNTVIVVGHPEYYPRFGFISARKNGLELSVPVPDEPFMVKELVPGSLYKIKGTVILPPEFDEFI
jgi:putative acetyltransferase